MLGFLAQWPTLLTLAMFPVLVWMYVRLARQEEREAAARLGGGMKPMRAACRHSSRTWSGDLNGPRPDQVLSSEGSTGTVVSDGPRCQVGFTG